MNTEIKQIMNLN